MRTGIRGMILLVLLVLVLPLSAQSEYRFSYELKGQASGKALIFVPFRVYYEAAASVQLTTREKPDGRQQFVFESVPIPGYVLRTLGFAGKTGGILVAAADYPKAKEFAATRIERWKREDPEYGGKVSAVKVFPYKVASTLRSSFLFDRNPRGEHGEAIERIVVQYEYYPSVHGLYFRVFPMAAALQGMYNHSFLPAQVADPWGELPSTWDSPPLDFSEPLNRVAWLTEKVVKSVMTVRQKAPFVMHYRVANRQADLLEIVGECRPDAEVWKGFLIREMRRRVVLRPSDRALLDDELSLTIGNDKGQGLTGWCQLKRIE